nr:MAG TPA: hypothetical protein [Caudoviricetes sp.]
MIQKLYKRLAKFFPDVLIPEWLKTFQKITPTS